MKKTEKLVDPGIALRIVDSLEKQATKTSDLHLKRILLTSGCEILDHVLKQQMATKAA